MSTVTRARPQRSILRTLLIAILVGAATTAMSLWWFEKPEAAGSAPPNETAQVQASLVPVPDPLSADKVANLEIVQQGSADERHERAIAYVHVPSAAELTVLLDQFVAEQIRTFDREHGGDADAELNIGWEIPTAAGQHLGIRLIATMSRDGAPPQVESRTFHTQVDRGTTAPSANLFSDRGKTEATRLITSALTASARTTVDLSRLPNLESVLFVDVMFDSSGAIIVNLPRDLLPNNGSGRQGVKISSNRVASLLTERGKEVRAAYMEDEPFLGLPEPAPVNTDGPDDPEAGKLPEVPVTTGTKDATDTQANNEDKAKSSKDDAAKPQKKSTKKAVNCKKAKCIALTFDDGPGPHTAKLLKILKKADVPATFFLLGRNVGVYPDVVEAMSKQGHEIANHAWSHKDLTRLSTKKISKELADTHKAIKKATGVAPELVRPPYGAVDKAVRKVLKGRDEPVILWDVDTEDWKNRNAKKTTRAALKGAQNGSIILMHDIHSSTVDAVPGIIKGLRKEGYTFVTVSQLLGETTPGQVYYSR